MIRFIVLDQFDTKMLQYVAGKQNYNLKNITQLIKG